MLLLLVPWLGYAQRPDSARVPVMRKIDLSNVDVAPTADSKGWLLLDKDIQTELDGAIHNLYNFKFDKAEKQFRSLRRRYPEHPLPYLLMGLSQWWKIMPTSLKEKKYDKIFFAYMDTTVTKAEVLYRQDGKNYEACFFLSAAYGFDAHLNAERKNWSKATVSSKRALDYLDKSKEANGLSPEFLFGQALFNYYQVWIADNYPLLRPVMLFFPKGNKQLGLRQLRSAADNGFYTATEAKFFLMQILFDEEKNLAATLPTSHYLATNFPDNAYFQRFYALNCFHLNDQAECERVSREILAKINQGLPGYEAISGRYATYFLGTFMQQRQQYDKAREYFQRCVVFAESTGETSSGFYLSANLNLARLADDAHDTPAAVRYYSEVEDKAARDTPQYREAKEYLKAHRKDS
ncbi:tetratricopeptide repeat protein [Hymenobacter persicinus]|uniref:tetratricopeptide repeat protein n=1 Tax=Hymenobacter persicinus TaxID=2025506 RepID=UPI001F5DDD0D|nr:tetratricopeptide repeat protein [Hymenobacter persicinus]